MWLYRPVALEEQARELLRRRDFEAALQLAAACVAQRAPWAEAAFAQAALLLMQGGAARFCALLPLLSCASSLSREVRTISDL